MSRPLLFLLALAAAPVLHAAQPKSLADIPSADPAVEKAAFIVPEGFEISLFAADPMIQKPVQMNWDKQGRLWVVSSTTYPHIKPGEEAKDQIVVLEDTNGDGVADKQTVFAEGLHIPTAVMPADGGCYVANSTEILFLKDNDGDLKADERNIILSGFGTEDTHHLVHTMRLGPEGMLYFLQSIYIHSHIETPYGVRRLLGGGVWEFRPETRKLEYISKGLINPWGFEFDRWGQSFAADGAGSEGVNFIFPGSVFATSPGAKRILHGMSPGQPKHAGQEIVDDPYWPADWQGSVIHNDFRGGRINRFTLTPSGSSYVAKQEKDVLASNHIAFRPIDLKFGPDGALYIADWYNPIIQHGEVDFRDERRDHVHGRIWRLTVKGKPTPERPAFAGKPVPELLDLLKSDRKYVRHFAKRELRDQGGAVVKPALNAWIEALDKNDANYEHHLLEAAWTRECINSFSAKLWQSLWAAKDYRVRAAALRILTHRWKELPTAMDVCKAAVADENAQVRLWGLCVLAEMKTPASIEMALRVLDKPMDESLDFKLEQMCGEGADVWLQDYLKGKLKITNTSHSIYALRATGRSEALEPLLATLKAGKLNDTEAAAILDVAAATCNAKQADELLALIPGDTDARKKLILDALTRAGSDRKVVPAGAEAFLQEALKYEDDAVFKPAAVLAGVWKIESARERLSQVFMQAKQLPATTESVMLGLTKLGGVKTRDLLDKRFGTAPELVIRGLTEVAPALAAKRAVEFLGKAPSPQATTAVLSSFLKNKQLPGQLAKELEGKTIPEAVAIEGIRLVNTRGVKGPLEEALKKAGGVKQMDQQLTPEAMSALVAKVNAEGNPARGEEVFRRQQMQCFFCHAIGDAGGVLGPNLVSIGASAPVDYLIESLLNPSAKIKEGYHMVIVSKKDGGVVSGGLVQDGAEELIIRDPANQLQKVAKSQIASRVISPASMMPPGLTASLRQDEFVDLVSFLSKLGKEGDFKIKPNKYVRTWKTMGAMEQPDVDHLRHDGLPNISDRNYKFPWTVSYSKVNGDLDLTALPAMMKMYPWFPKIAQFGLKLAGDGKVKLGLSETKGVVVVVDNEELKELKPQLDLDLKAGQHLVTVFITRDAGDLKTYRVELLEGAAALE